MIGGSVDTRYSSKYFGSSFAVPLSLQKSYVNLDASLRLRTDQESGQTILSGMGELHLEIIIDRLKSEYGVDANIGAPQVAYRETITKAAAKNKKASRTRGLFYWVGFY